MEGTGIGKDLTEIAGLLIGVALVALLVMNAGGTSALIGTGSKGFAGLLSTVEGQGLGFSSLGGLGSFGGSGSLGNLYIP